MKRVIRISESELNRLVKEAAASVAENVDEIGDTPRGQYALGQLHARNVHSKYDNVSAIDGPSADMYDEIEKRRGGDEWDDGVCKNPLYYDYADGYTDWIAHKAHGLKGSAGSGVNEGKTIRFTENNIKKMVMEALNELDWKTYDSAAEKAYRTKTKQAPTMYGDTPVRDMDLVRKFRKAKADAINDRYFNGEDESEYFPNGGNFAKGEYDMPPTVRHGKLSYQPGTEYDDSPITYNGSGAFIGGYKGPATYDDLVDAFNGDEEKARNFMAMCQEFSDYEKGKYKYEKGKGWTKDGLDEAVTRAVRRCLR